MSLTSILSGIPKRLESAAQAAVIFVRQTAGTLSGEAQHLKAVKVLLDGAVELATHEAHALVALAFGFLQKNSPAVLQNAVGEIKQEVDVKVDAVAADTKARLTTPPLSEPAPATPAPASVGESLAAAGGGK